MENATRLHNSKRLSLLESEEIAKRERPVRLLKIGVWLYFFLLIFEGALRKWFLPGFSELILIIRDPVGIVIMVYAWYYRLFPTVNYIVAMFIIGGIAFFTTLFIGHGNIFVSLFGARILLIHFPLIFLIGTFFNKDDVIKMGKVIVWISIPMVILIALQFYSPQSALVNRGVGGNLEGSGFSGAMEFFRPSGTFSFTNGTTLFFSMAASFIFYFWLRPNGVHKIVLLAATVALIAAIPLSISRGLVFSIGVILIFLIFSVSQKPKFMGQIVVTLISFFILVFFLQKIEFFQTSTEVLQTRFDNAARSEGGLEGTLVDRYLGGLISAIVEADERPFFGKGLGLGTNAGSALMGSGRVFLLSEGEWGRLIGEMGAVLGIATIVIRLLLSFDYALKSFRALKREKILPWMLLSFALLVFPQGQWAQPTTLGFSTLIMGLLIASLNDVKHPATDSGKQE
ncbi:MAG: hypothetical protein ABR574_03150 [Cryomorphaceae bacterium]|nr:hypothetical protein [Flavobacteriales bacterium]